MKRKWKNEYEICVRQKLETLLELKYNVNLINLCVLKRERRERERKKQKKMSRNNQDLPNLNSK
jgi:hypothetical protein